jgi:hypothetical protein
VSFDHPGLALGALLALLPPLLHLLDRRRPRPRPFAAIDFLLRARKGGERRFRLRRLLLMLTRMALLAAIPLALARPHRANAARLAQVEAGPRATALVIDGSGSMRYRRGSQDLFSLARTEARHRLADLNANEPTTALLCTAGVGSPAPPTEDRAALLETLEGFAVGEGPADLAGCIDLAAQALARSDVVGKRIVVFTDLQQTDWSLARNPPVVPTPQGNVRPDLEVVDVAKGPMPNLALSDLTVVPSPAIGPHGYQFGFTVHNFSAEAAANVSVSLDLGGRVVARGFCDLGPFEAQRKTLAATLAPGAVAEGRVLLPADALAEDDAIPFVVPVPRQARVLVVDGAPSSLRYLDEAFFVQTALEAAANAVSVRTVDPEALSALDLDSSALDAVLLLNVRSLNKDVSAALKRFVEQGGGLLVAVGDRVDPEALNDSIGALLPAQLRLVKTAAQPVGSPSEDAAAGTIISQAPAHFTHVDFGSALFAGFSGGASDGLLDTRIFRYLLVEPPAKDVVILASYDDGAPAVLLARRKAGQVLLFTTSAAREWTDWPIRTSFVAVIQQAVLLLAHLGQEQVPAIQMVGSRYVFPEGDRAPVAARTASGANIPIGRTAGGLRVIERLPEVGLMHVQLANGEGKRVDSREADIPVAFDPRESDTRRLDPNEITARYGAIVRSDVPVTSAGFQRLSFWMQLLVLGVAFFSAEALLAG